MSRRIARWAVPAGVVAVLAGSVVLVPVVAGADPSLPERSAAELLAEVSEAQAQPFSGTVVETADLGFRRCRRAVTAPPLRPGDGLQHRAHLVCVAGQGAGGPSGHARGDRRDPQRRRRVGMDKRQEHGQHFVLPSMMLMSQRSAHTGMVTPSEAAEQALEAVDPTTRVTVDGTSEVAGRPVYELVLAPRDERSLIGQVRLAVDAETSMPLRVQVYAAGATEPAFETGFTSVSFSTPDDSVFAFSPPPGAEVEENELAEKTSPGETSCPTTSAMRISRPLSARAGRPWPSWRVWTWPI